MKLPKQFLIPNTIICLILIFFFQVFIWQKYIAAKIYQRITNSSSINAPPEINEELINYLRQAIRLTPLVSEYQFKIGELFLAQNEHRLAQKWIINSLILEPTNTSYYLKLGLSYILSGKQDKAEKEFYKIESLDSNNALLFYELSDYYARYFGKDKQEITAVLYKKALFFSEKELQFKIMETIYTDQNRSYSELKYIMPNRGVNRYLLAEFLRDKKLFDESIAEYKKAIILVRRERNNHILPDSYNWIAIIYFWQGKYNVAIEYFRKAAALTQDHQYRSWILSNLGDAYLRIGELEKSRDAYEKSMYDDPLRGDNYYGLGIIYEALKMKPQAIDYFQRALKFNLGENAKKEINKRLDSLSE